MLKRYKLIVIDAETGARSDYSFYDFKELSLCAELYHAADRCFYQTTGKTFTGRYNALSVRYEWTPGGAGVVELIH